MTRINFQEVNVKAIRRWKDESGKKRQETKTFYQTISPFNKGPDGEPKTRDQIMAEITKERDEWLSYKEHGYTPRLILEHKETEVK